MITNTFDNAFEANSNLIMASPELLEASIKFVNRMLGWVQTPEEIRELRQLQKAIAKALGN